jgi:tRNA(Ile)-lysidine synthase TilS/MesJ
MIKLLGKIPNTVTLACSGGPDSMAALDFLMRGRKRVKVAHFDHGTEHGSKARKILAEFKRENEE